MHTTPLTLAALALLLSASSLTTTAHPTTYPQLAPRAAAAALTADTLQKIAPQSSSCTGATHADECKTAQQALAPILASFQTYKITDPATQAAVLSTIALESADFKYAKHYFPSPNPGQGTRNMQSAKYNLQYAQSIPELAPLLAKVDTKNPEAVLELIITYADYDFGSAAWFLTSQCSKETVQGLSKPGEEAFGAYLKCIGTEASDDRQKKYEAALAALGVKSS